MRSRDDGTISLLLYTHSSSVGATDMKDANVVKAERDKINVLTHLFLNLSP
jgi:hypothetical protein